MGKGVVKLGEGNWAVKDGNLLAAKETNGRFKNAEFTVARGTRATYVGKDGLIKESNLQDVNLVTNGSFDTDSDWSTIGTWDIVNNQAEAIGNGISQYIQQDFTISNGNIYKFTYEIIENTLNGNGASLSSSGGFGSVSISNVVGTHTEYITASNDTATYALKIGVSGTATSGTIKLDNVSVQEVKTDTPRIDFTDNTDGHLLLEPQSTNLVTYSEDFSEWNNSDTTDAISTINSPDGTQNATTITASGSGVLNHIISSDDFTIASGDITASIFAKKGTVDYLRLRFDGTTSNERAWYNLNNGTIDGEDSSGSAKIEDFGNGWYRCILTSSNNTASGDCGLQVFVQDSGGTQTSWEANGTQNIHIWGGQVEQLEYPTSYIPTNGGTVTRDAETCTGSGEAIDFNSEEGVLYAEVARSTVHNNYELLSISPTNNSDGTHYASLGYNNTDNKLWIRAKIGNTVAIASIGQVDTVLNQFYKIAIKYKSGENAIYVDGEKLINTDITDGSEATTFTPTQNTISDLEFRHWDANNSFYGKVKAIRVYKEALSDSELVTLTS